jgi:hypothetical protein
VLQSRTWETFFFFFFLVIRGFELRAYVLARQELYHFSHASSPFCSGYFGDGVLLFAQASLDHDPTILCFPP